MNIRMIWVLLSAMLVATTVPVMAGDGEHDSHHGQRSQGGDRSMFGMPDPARMVRHMSRRLELDEAQSQQLNNVVVAATPQLTALHEKSRANREAIAALDLDAGDYDSSIQRLAAESGEIAIARTLLLSQLRRDIHSRLTPEQQQKLADTADHMRHHWRKHGDKRHGEHGDGPEQ